MGEQGGERARQGAAACAAPRACVALPSQGSQERDAEETLAGGVSGCPEDGFTETAAPKARAIGEGARVGRLPHSQAPGAGRPGALPTATAR